MQNGYLGQYFENVIKLLLNAPRVATQSNARDTRAFETNENVGRKYKSEELSKEADFRAAGISNRVAYEHAF